ncbi:MAG: hypothetical protein WA777_20375 [Rhodanobacter sp.]
MQRLVYGDADEWVFWGTTNLIKGIPMSDVIDFLERMGQDAQLRHASRDDVELAMADVQIEPALREAILAKNSAQLQTMLGEDPPPPIQMPSEEEEDETEEEAPPPKSQQQASQPDLHAMTIAA